MTSELAFTGERFTPECVREIFYEHMHRYVMAGYWVRGLEVLDAACGEGYGSAILAQHAASVQGLDLAMEAVEHARQRYVDVSGLGFQQGDCCQLPFDDASFDAIVSFETLEHLERQSDMLAEFRRVLRPEGFLIISTPDRAIYSDAQDHDNPYHVKELYQDEFTALLKTHFPATRLLGQRLMFQSVIWPLDNNDEAATRFEQMDPAGITESGGDNPLPAVYLLAQCAANEDCLPPHQPMISLFHDSDESVYAHYHHEIRKNMAAGALLEKLQARVEQLEQAAGAGQPQSSAVGLDDARSWRQRLADWLRGGR